VNFFKGISDEVYKHMKKRCEKQPKFFNTDSKKFPSIFGGRYRACKMHVKIDGDEKSRVYKCSERFINPDMLDPSISHDHVSIHDVAITFGKIDAMTILPVPHSYWSSIFRSYLLTRKIDDMGSETEKSEHIDIINIPSHRIKYGITKPQTDKNHNKNDEEEITNISFKKPYTVFTFIQFPKTLIKYCDKKDCYIGDRPCLRKNHLKRLCKELLASDDVQFNKEIQNRGKNQENNPRIEFFLTFSCHYQGIIKAEFQNFDDIGEFLDKIKCLEAEFLLSEIASIIGLNGKFLIKKSEAEEKYDKAKNSDVDFAILLKLKGTEESTDQKGTGRKKVEDYFYDFEICRNEIESILKKSMGIKNFKIFSRAFFWDVLIIVRVKKVYDFVMNVINELRKSPFVMHALSIPLWELGFYTPGRESKLKEWKNKKKVKETKIYKIQGCKAWQERARQNFAERSDISKEILALWEKYKKVVPRNVKKKENVDALANRIYNQKFDLELIFAYLLQLEAGWTMHLLTHPLRTFDLLLKNLENIYKNLKKLCEDKVYLDKEKNPNDKKEIWRKFSDIVDGISSLKETISNLITEYNDKKEGSQITWMTAPYLRIGQRAGVIDLYTEGLNDLFKEYCGKFFNVIDLWKGLVTPSSGRDFSIIPIFQVLHLPVDIKFHVHGRLPIMAHEAAHFIFWCLFEAPDSSYFIPKNRELNDALENHPDFSNRDKLNSEIRKKIKDFKDSIWEEMFSRAKKEAERVLKNDEDWKILVINNLEKVKGKLERDQQIMPGSLEFLVDLLAGLLAGPAYFKSFGLLYYQASPSFYKESKGKKQILHTYPMFSWVRTYLGILLWGKRNQWKDWLEDYWELPSYFDEAIAKLDIEEAKDIRSYSKYFRDSEIEDFDPRTGFKKKSVPEFFTDYNTYLINAFFSRGEEGNCLIDLFVNFFKEFFDENFFFFGDNGGIICDDASTSEKRKTTMNCRKKSKECLQIASQLVFDNKIILEGRLKDIAAASIMKPIKRPVVPSGRILHSLYYGTGKSP
jgi:hypothetical protein